jgi:hypothetical protein
LVFLPFLGAFGDAAIYPNQSGLRFLPFAIAVFLLGLSLRWPLFRAIFFLGMGAGLGLLINFETGLVVTAAFSTWLFLRRGDPGQWAKAGGLFAAGLLSMPLLWFLAHRLGLGHWPLPESSSDLLGWAGLGSAGGIGAKAPQRLHLGLLLFAHAAYVLIHTTLKKDRSPRGTARAAIATAVVIWFAYYANRGDRWNLWTLIFLSSFLWDRALFPLSLQKRRLGLKKGILPVGVLAFAMAIGPQALLTHQAAWSRLFLEFTLTDAVQRLGDKQSAISGVHINPLVASALENKAAALKDHPHAKYITANAFVLPLMTERGSGLPVGHPFGSTHTHVAYKTLLDWMIENGGPLIVVDDPNYPVPRKGPQMTFLRRLREDLKKSGYAETRTESGWVHLERGGP